MDGRTLWILKNQFIDELQLEEVTSNLKNLKLNIIKLTVKNIMKKMKMKKSAGPDEISQECLHVHLLFHFH